MKLYSKYLYQKGGVVFPEVRLPASFFSSPLPRYERVLSDLRFRPGSTGDFRANAGLPDLSKIREQHAIKEAEKKRVEAEKERAKKEMIEKLTEKSMMTRVEQKKTNVPKIIDSRAQGDLAVNFNIPSREQVRANADMRQMEQQQLQHNLERLGQSKELASRYATMGWEQLPKWIQKDLEELAEGDMRVRYHYNYNPDLPIESQQALKEDNSLYAGLTRQRNKLLDGPSPVINFLNGLVTAPAQAFMNLTMGADEKYVKPGLVEGATNLGNDLLTLWPNAPNVAAKAVVSRASPRALGYMVNPVVQGADDVGRMYFNTVANSGTVKQLAPGHSNFAVHVTDLLDRGVPLRDAVRASYRELPKDNRLGMTLVNNESPIEVYQKIKRAQEFLPSGGRWQNSSYSVDSYPLVMDYMNRRLDKETFKVIPSFTYENLNQSGFKSPDLLKALPKEVQDVYRLNVKKLDELNRDNKLVLRELNKVKGSELEKDLLLRQEANDKSAVKVYNTLSKEVNSLIKNDAGFRARLTESINDRIRKLNQQYNVRMPLAFATESDISVPQFFIEKKNPSITNRLLDFKGRVGLSKQPSFLTKDDFNLPDMDPEALDRMLERFRRMGASSLPEFPAISPSELLQFGGIIPYNNLSIQGYKSDSPDRFNAFNIIPSNNITMKNVGHPVLGIDNTGASQVMHPGNDYLYPGSVVLELPFRRYGGVYPKPCKHCGDNLRKAQEGGDAVGYIPFFKTDAEREDYRRRLSEEAVKALGAEDDRDYLRFTSYHTTPDGYDCINGVCGLDLRAGLHYSNPTDGDRYLSNSRFVNNIKQGKEDYYQVNGNFQVGDHFQFLSDKGNPTHSMKLYKVDRDENNKPINYRFIQNGGGTVFEELTYSPEELKKATRGFVPEMIAWRPGKMIDKDRLAEERKVGPFPYNAGTEQVEQYFGDTFLPTRFWLKSDGSSIDKNSPLYYFSRKNVQDDTKSELVKLMNDKELDRTLREKLHISDGTLQNLKPVIFGIAGVESNFNRMSGSRGFKEQVSKVLKSDPSVGPFQIRLGSVSDRAKEAFDINNQRDLEDLKKGYIAAVDRMLEGKRVTDAMIERGYHPELANADPYFRASYYYNQPGKVLQRDEDWAKENYEGSIEEAEYNEFLNENRLRGDEGSYMYKVQQAAYPLGMEVLDDEDPSSETGISELPAVEVIGKRKVVPRGASAPASSTTSTNNEASYSSPRRSRGGRRSLPPYQKGGWMPGPDGVTLIPNFLPYLDSMSSWKAPVPSVYNQLDTNPFPGLSPLASPVPIGATAEHPIGKVSDRLSANPFPGMFMSAAPTSRVAMGIKNSSVYDRLGGKPSANNPEPAKPKRGANIPLATGIVSGLSFINSALEGKERNKYDKWQKLLGLSDSTGPVVPGSRGDYTFNEGYFRPDQYTPVQFGSIPYAQYGGYFDVPKDLSPIGLPDEVLAFMGSDTSASAKSFKKGYSGKDIPVPNMEVEPNEAAREAYKYYVEEKDLAPHVAAGIVGNLYQESALRPGAKEKGNTGNGRGIAQWDVRNRWQGLVEWASKNKRDPYEFYTQLDYILIEPGESTKVFKALQQATSPEEASYIFGKTYERPMDKQDIPHTENPARWDVRAGIARRLYDEFEQPDVMQLGGEASTTLASAPTTTNSSMRRLKPEEMLQWNQFLDYVKQSGYEGSQELNIRNKKLGESLFNKFKSSNPSITIGYDIVPNVQNEMQLLRQQAQDFARRRNDPNANNLMNDISPVDGWFGSRTSQFRFPYLASQDIHNGQVVQTQNQGLVNANWQGTSGNTGTGTVKKALPAGVQPFQNKDGVWLYEDPQTGDLVRYQRGGGVVEHFKKQMLKKDGKYLITDKGTNRTYYGYPGPDGKLIEDSFEVLTGKSNMNSYVTPYFSGEMDKMSKKASDNAKVTPIGVFPLQYMPYVYGNPGLRVKGTIGVAMHQTYDPAVRNKYYNNNNPGDNYASYGCINCRKPDIDKVLKGFGDKDYISIVDSRRSIDENNAIGEANKYLYNNPVAAKMLFEQPGSHFVKRQWNAAKGVYEGKDSDYDPATDTIISKKDLGNVIVSARKPKQREVVSNVSQLAPVVLTPLQESLLAMGVPVNELNVSIVDYLNERGIDSSRANRLVLAHSLGMDDYRYTGSDNINLLRILENLQEEGRRALLETGVVQMRRGGDVDAGEEYNLRRSLGPVDRGEANIEAERGEIISGDFDGDGMNEHLAVGGERHSRGGTPLRVPAGSFVFSDTRKMRIGGDLLGEFGKGVGGKKKYTPAELAKQYEIEKYKAIILDPASDKMAKDTAKLMLENNQLKLSKLALLQEGMKGFPNGIPSIALPLIQTALAMTPDMGGAMDVSRGVPVMEGREMRYGGLVKAQTGYSVPSSIEPYQGSDPRERQRKRLKFEKGFNKFDASWLKDYGYGTDAKGLNDALLSVGYKGNLSDAKEIQKFLIQRNMDVGNYQLFNDLLENYDMTNQGIKEGVYREPKIDDGSYIVGFETPDKMKDNPTVKTKIEKAYVDGLFGVRSGLMLKALLSSPKPGVTSVPAASTPAVATPSSTTASPAITPLSPGETNVRPYPFPSPVDSSKWERGEEIPMRWWTQDVLNTGAALMNRYGLQRFGPTYVSPDVVVPRPTFFDPTRQLAANQEQAAAQNMMTAMYAGPQRQRGVGTNIQGQAAGNAANILSQVQNQNVGVANQFAGVTSDILNKKAEYDAAAKQKYIDSNTISKQNYINSKLLGNANVLANINSGITNAQETYWLNKLNEQYGIDPRSGQLNFRKGKSWPDSSSGTNADVNDAALYNYYYNQFKAANPNLSEEDAKAFATLKIQARQRLGNNSDGGGSIGIGNYMSLPIGQGDR